MNPPFEDQSQKEVLARLRTARGHLEGVARMVEDGRSCVEVLHQLSAVNGAIAGIRRSVLECHIRRCTQETIRAGAVDDALEEIVALLLDGPPDPASTMGTSGSAGAR